MQRLYIVQWMMIFITFGHFFLTWWNINILYTIEKHWLCNLILALIPRLRNTRFSQHFGSYDQPLYVKSKPSGAVHVEDHVEEHMDTNVTRPMNHPFT